jgi:hypothetical protein
MKGREQERLDTAEEAMFACTVAEIQDGIRALQGTDTADLKHLPGTEELHRKLFRRLEAFKKREVGGRWGELLVRTERGGLRHYLEGQPVHAGAGLVLQSVSFKQDDYGQYGCPLQIGTPVRYEASFGGSSKVLWSLFTSLGGHEFSSVGEPWMRFRWPERK